MKIKGIESDAIYKATVCARCGELLLRRYLGTEYLDGGFTQNDKFERKPDSWQYHDTTGTLCPDCEALYQSQLQSFLKYTVEAKNEN